MFASQWGMIRKNPDYNTLFEEKTGYLMHGVAKDKWDKKIAARHLCLSCASIMT